MEKPNQGQGVTLWGVGTMRTHRTQWCAREMGIDYQLEPVGPRTGQTKTPEFLKLNPRHKVPVLTHGELVLTESAAILTYLTEAFPAPDHFLVPTSAIERARLYEWCFFIMSELDANALYTMRRHGDLKEVYGDAPIAVAAAKDYFHQQIDAMEGRFKTAGEFLMGGRMSIADILFMSCLDWALFQGLVLPEYLVAYRERLASRPAYLDALAANYPGGDVAKVIERLASS